MKYKIEITPTVQKHIFWSKVSFVLYLQAKYEFLCDAHECHSYDTGKE